MGIPAPNGLIVRYAMKANPTRSMLQLFDGMGAHIDASTFNEVQRARAAGVDGSKIRLTSQEVQSPEQGNCIFHKGRHTQQREEIKKFTCSRSRLRGFGQKLKRHDAEMDFSGNWQ